MARPSGAWESGKNDPPSTASVSATMAMAPPACSSVLANPTTSVAMPVAAIAIASTSAATASGSPQLAPRSSVVAVTMTLIETIARTRLTSTLPNRIALGPTGEASIRASVPVRRSASSPTTPNCAAKKTNSTAIEAP